MTRPILEVRDLHKRYGDSTVALERVSVAVAAGEMFGLLGPNGAGKTTLLSIVSCQLEATGGEVLIQGRPLLAGDKEVRRDIGLVPQDLALYGELSARENLEFFGGIYGLHGPGLHRRADELLQALDLAGRADERVEGLSWGVKRRLNLAAALLHEPRLLLLDEPTTGVDPQSRHCIFTEVRRLNQAGVTVVYTSHYMEEVQALCPRIGIIDHGKLIACDTLPALLQQLDGLIRFKVRDRTDTLLERVRQLPEVRLTENNGRLELHCRDIRATLPKLVAALQELQIELTGLEMQEPNLERVFLHLTGHGLRD